MDYASNKPLGLQVYKTPAEYKALRLNRTEQCRLNCTRTYLTRQERNFNKDHKTSRIKLQKHYQRQFALLAEPREGLLAGTGSALSSRAPSLAWSAASTPRSVSASLSARRSSHGLAFSVSSRRSSAWSLPGSAVRADLLQRRRQTYAGEGDAGEAPAGRVGPASARSVCRGSASSRGQRSGVVSERRSVSARRHTSFLPGSKDCDLDGRHASEGVLSNGVDAGPADPEAASGQQVGPARSQEGKGAPSGEEGRPPPVPVPEIHVIDCADNADSDPKADQDRRELAPPDMVKASLSGPDTGAPESPSVSTDITDGTIAPDQPLQQNPARVKTTGSLRRFSRISKVMQGLNGMANPLKSAESTPAEAQSSQGEKNHSKDVPADCGNFESPAIEETNGEIEDVLPKVNRKVSIMETPVKLVPHRTKTATLSAQLHLPSNSKDSELETQQDNVREHAAELESVIQRLSPVPTTYRESSVAFVDVRRDSGSVGKSVLQGRVWRFLEQQQDFNRRFPLRRHEVTSLECSRPDLLQAGRTEQDAGLSKAQEGMIAEVLEKLGMEETDIVDFEKKDSKKLFPPLNR